MPPFKFKFTAHPQHDAEGFTAMDAKCRGCTPDEMCPRSGHCERYESPLRDVYGIAAEYINQRMNTPTSHPYDAAQHNRALDVRINTMLAPYGNPKGWQEVDGVYLPSVADWHNRDNELAREGNARAVKLSEMTDAELNEVHSQWLRNGRSE